MSLDLSQLINQIHNMTDYFKLHYSSRSSKLDYALKTVNSDLTDFKRLSNRINDAKTTWLVAGLCEKIDNRKLSPPCPFNHQVVAVDGSHIDVNRHQSARCFLINIGNVALRYGDNPDAILYCKPRLFYSEDDLVIKSLNNKQVPIEGQLLGIKRSIDECRGLLELVKFYSDTNPVLALLDGTLIMWGLAGQEYQDYVVEYLLINDFFKLLDEFKKICNIKPVVLASYISFPRSTEVVNALRLAVCPHDNVNCDVYCSGNNINRDCDKISGLIDRDVFDKLLCNGERSSLFFSRSSIVEKYYKEHRICFFYVKLENEICRVEIPQWIAEREDIVDFIHASVLKQCELGYGYPVALMEAHEQAVVTGSEREQFWQLVEQISREENTEIRSSGKQRSKKMKWI